MAEKLEFDLTVKNNQLSKALDESAKKSSDLGSALSGALSVFGGNLITKGFDILIGSINDLINVAGESIDAAAGQEVATNNLNNALARSGNLTKQATAELASFASILQATSVYEDDAVLSSAALLQSLTKLNVQGLQSGVKAAADFATVLGIDLETATRLVAKAAEGNVEAFKRYGVEIKKGSTDSESFANTIKALNTQFGGAASSQLNTYNGALKAVNNAYSDLLEPIGEIVVKNPLVVASFVAIKDILNEANTSIAENNGVFKTLVQDGMFAAISASQVLFDALDGITVVLKAVGNIALLAANAFNYGIIEPVKLAIDAIIKLGSFLPIIGDEIEKLQNPLASTSDTIKNNMVVALDDLKNSADSNIFRAMSNGADNFANKIIDTSATIQIANNELSNSNNARKTNEEEVDQAILNRRSQLGIELNALTAQLATEEKIITDALYAQSIQDDSTRKQAEITALYENEFLKLEAMTEMEMLKTQMIKDEAEKRAKQDTIIADAQIKAVKLNGQKEIAEKNLINENKKKSDDAYKANLGTTLDQIATLQTSGNKTLIAVGKAAALSQLAISGPVAFGKALELGPIIGPPLAAAVAASFASQAAKVAGVQFEQGGVVGGFTGGSVGADNRTATIRDGEMILNAQDQKTLFDAIKSGNLGGGNIQLIIDGREIAYAVRNQVQGGFRLA